MCRSVHQDASGFLKGYTMKKLIVSFLICISILAAFITAAGATEILLFAPAESEIMPTRDFYVVGKINRKGQSAANMPLNIKIELYSEDGVVIRSLESRVGASGTTPAEYFLLDYEQGTAFNDSKGAGINLLTPPDIMFNGADRNSIRSMSNKLVVKEDYFAAVIYGGATKDFELDYFDEEQKPVTDITEGKYNLIITAFDLNEEEVCRKEVQLIFGNKEGRVIASDTAVIADYQKDNNLTFASSVAGLWTPSDYFSAQKDFTYYVSKRFNDNIALEYGNAKSVNVLLYNLDTSDKAISQMLTSAYENQSEKTYLYFDIGEKEIKFNLNGALLTKTGSVLSNTEDSFIEILRSETVNDDDTYMDFNQSDGFVLSRGNKTVFYGVFSPIVKKRASDTEDYKFADATSFLKYTLTDKDGNVLTEDYTTPYLTRNEESAPARYEFSFEITPDAKMSKADASHITLSLCNSDKEVIYEAMPVSVKINRGGNFIGNYDDSYWGKSFCDTINALGQNPQEEPLDPDEFITRGNFAAMINRLFGYSISSENSFADLDDESIYYEDCSTAQAVGYMTGDEHARVKADDFISREQAMIILARISKATQGEETTLFKDSDKVSFWAKSYVDIMTSNGIVSGFEGYLNPTDSITVAEATALIIKTYKWMYAGEIKNADIDTSEKEDFTNAGFEDVEFISDVNYDSVSAFLNANSETLTSLINHFIRNYKNGIYISRVGNGLEVRDYLVGGFVNLPDDVLNVTTALSGKFAEFSIRYNPKSENAVHFILGRDENGKQVGLTYTALEEVKNKALTHIDGNWYYYIQK